MNGETLDKARTLEVLASTQKSFDLRADLDVVKAINKKSLEVIKEI